MGDEAVGDGGEAHVAIPLSGESRDRIRAALESLSVEIVGQDPGRLIDLVELALTINIDDLFLDEQDALALEGDKAADRIGTAALALEVPLRSLLEVAEEVDDQLEASPADLEAAAVYDDLDSSPLAEALKRLRRNDAAHFGRAAAPILDRALADLRWIREQVDSLASPFFVAEPAFWLVRAVMYYRHEQGLSLSNNWAADPNFKRHGRRDDKALLPASPTAELVAQAARAFGVRVAHRTLRSMMNAYQAHYRSGVGVPVLADFGHPFRHIR